MMIHVSTHVLDLANGRPASGVEVHLCGFNYGEWRLLESQITSEDGRASFLDLKTPYEKLRLNFVVLPYLKAHTKTTPFYEDIPVIFVPEPSRHKYHVPLLLNQYGYSTYRGS